jgi:DMSO/TMAO reductase YedYZ molybdopterin-dependent catalytic subunit
VPAGRPLRGDQPRSVLDVTSNPRLAGLTRSLSLRARSLSLRAERRARALWRSPLRGPWLTSVFGVTLLVTLPLVVVTGLLDYVAYGPRFGQAFPVEVGPLHLPVFDWPTRPSWLFRLTEGVHVGLGLVLVPVILAKLWSVVPRLFGWPPVRSFGHLVERLTVVPLVGGILFEVVTGVLNIQYDYVFGFDFYTAHYFGAWVFLAGFVAHVLVKVPTMVRGLRSRSLRAELRAPLSETRPETPPPGEPDSLVAASPASPTMSRRDLLTMVGGGSLLVAALSVGQTVDGLRRAAVLLPRGRTVDDGPTGFPINRTADAAGISPGQVQTWRLTLAGGPTPVTLDRAALAGLPQHTAELPIACVEGWSTTQTWTGVRLAELATLAGVFAPGSALIRSIERGGAFSAARLTGGQLHDPDALLATHVNGVPLSLDHGFPARVIVPALPGVHCTKWVDSIDFRSA